MPDGRVLPLDRPRIMGVLNLTPDSFSDGGRYPDLDAAVQAADAMLRAGADLLDIGGESTRPGAQRIDVPEQIDRTVPVIEAILRHRRSRDQPAPIISIDTTRAEVARAALDAGASIINDVSAGREDMAMFALAAARHCPLILMHMQGEPATMQDRPHYEDVVEEVRQFLVQRAEAAEATGVAREQIVIDPGIGFGKTLEHNLALLDHLDRFVMTGYPVLLGASRKRLLGTITGLDDPAQRDTATAAVTALAVRQGVPLIRVHNVPANRQAADVAYAISAAEAPRRTDNV